MTKSKLKLYLLWLWINFFFCACPVLRVFLRHKFYLNIMLKNPSRFPRDISRVFLRLKIYFISMKIWGGFRDCFRDHFRGYFRGQRWLGKVRSNAVAKRYQRWDEIWYKSDRNAGGGVTSKLDEVTKYRPNRQ